MTTTASRWHTARRYYRCEDAYQWAHAGQIRKGDRYVLVTVLRSDVVAFGTRARYCSECAGSRGFTPDVARIGSTP